MKSIVVTSLPTRGFTLIEILIVVIILGILAAVVVPQFSNASQIARESTLKDELRYLRTQIILYKAEHGDVVPGSSGGVLSSQAFVNQMTMFTDQNGNTSSAASSTFKFGPYLSTMPTNPVNTLNTINVVNGSGSLTPDGSTGFVYQPQSQTILPNLTGSDVNGVSYANY